MLLLIDNYDSFTYNLAQYFAELEITVKVIRNDQINIKEIASLQPKYIVISPGPCTPNEAGISLQVIKHFAGKIPILGVCLGHQAIVHAFGGVITHAKQIMHGKTSKIYHSNKSIFQDLPNPFTATRYHSLVAEYESLPDCLEPLAWTQQQDSIDQLMAVRHKSLPLVGIQFHPESILTTHGQELLRNYLYPQRMIFRVL